MYSGTIYDSNVSPVRGEIVITLDLPQVVSATSKFLSKLGLGLMISGALGVLITTAPIIKEEVSYRITNIISPRPQLTGFGELTMQAQAAVAGDNLEKEYAKNVAADLGITDTNFYIYIPKINARAPIVADVNPAVPETFKEALKLGVAQAQGTSTPDEPGTTYLFAHSTDSPLHFVEYNAIFYLLHTVNPDDHDEILVFYHDKLYKYKIVEKYIVDANDTSWLLDKSSDKRLILQTCWPPGTSWKRLIIIAAPVEG